MSRLIVKNLPSKITEKKLREAFSLSESSGVVTDAQLKYTKDGKFRHFGFVGFQNEDDARKAKEYLDGTFLGACKISVQTCADLGDEKNKPRAWSKYAKDSSAYRKLHGEEKKETKEKPENEQEKKVDELMEKYRDDPKFQEFLRAHKRNTAEEWNNEMTIGIVKSYREENEQKEDEKEEQQKEDKEENEPKLALKPEVSDLEYLKSLSSGVKKKRKNKEPKNEEYFTVKLVNLPYKAKKKDVKGFFGSELRPKSIRVPPKIKGIAFAGFSTEKEMKQALNKNKSFLNGHQIHVIKYENKTKEANSEPKRFEEVKEDVVAESGRLFIRNLSYNVTEEDLENVFKKFGPLTEVNLPIDRLSRKVKGFAFITFMMPENAVQAFNALDGTTFQGRLLHIIPGKLKDDNLQDSEDLGFKEKKKLKEKAAATSSHNWNTLFLGSSAVADVMAEQYNVSKKDVLLSEGKQTAAVRLALGETQIVSKTREFLEEEGICLESFENKTNLKRSKHVIIVKNLPARTAVEEIRDLFAKYGELGRVVLPPNGITAVVEFFEPSEARAAFKKLAYTKFHDGPLYLEFAPENAFKTPPPNPDPKRDEEESKDEEKEEQEVEEPEANSTLFIKNLNFETDEERIRNHFVGVGKIHKVTVARKKDMSKPGGLLSMGYGFIQFQKASAADKALKTLQHSKLDDHCLELKRSNRTSEPVKSTDKNKSKVEQSTKILIRNIPFEANKQEIEDLFKTFGELKFVRLPKKVTGSHRGFAFAEFNTKSDAKKAFDALCHSTHLYGRRLVLEWAAPEETIEDLRRKASRSAAEGAANPAPKRVKTSELFESITMTPKE